MLVTYENGEERNEDFSHHVLRKFKELRAGMYQEGKGTWFSMTYKIVRPGRFSTYFNYDEPPEYDIYPSAGSFATDLDYFPRTTENTPGWLREKLREAGGAAR